MTTADEAVFNRLTNRKEAPSWMHRLEAEARPAAVIAARIWPMTEFAPVPGPRGTSAELPEAIAVPVSSVKVTVTGTPSSENFKTLFWGVVPPVA
jgi:hypothetical protein